MGAFLDKPKIEKQIEEGKGNALEYAVSSMQGWRVDMEDSHTAKLSLPGLPSWSFFAVFDGHAGSKVAEHSSEHLLDSILSHANFKKIIESSEKGKIEDEKLVKKAIVDSFLLFDHKMRNISDAKTGFDRSGSTCVCVLITPHRFYFINCGDSRGLLCRQGTVEFATLDHKPCNPLERERIQNAGGNVLIQRVNGSLAVSRALGDYEYKNVEDKSQTEQLVSPEPDITCIERSFKEDEFIILACDGIFDVSNNEELTSYVLSRLAITDNLVTVCNDVVDMSLNKGSRDNMTLVLLALPSIPKPDEKAKEEEAKLDEQLRVLMKDVRNTRGENMDFSYILQTLITDESKIQGLPPGGGIYSKRAFLEKVYKELYPDENPTSPGSMN
uniref:PPM-type phosphatase domain-containing protein n=1 Tax=Ciona savignyi TaxID=51511 RepID=H2Z7Z9_CIOSA